MKKSKPTKNGSHPKQRMPKWKSRMHEYPPDQSVDVLFDTEADIDEAIGFVWGGFLTGMPFELGGDGMSLIVPKVGVPYFRNAGLKFTERPLRFRS